MTTGTDFEAIERAELRQQLRDLEEKFAQMQNELQIQIDSLFFDVARSTLASTTTARRTGTRDEEWVEEGRV